ncbi:SH3 domain-containing protein [Pacificibacter marinus]|uniref:Bacterial SH3 domain protein n=1 Tax=Pacificibacter marinus TaxID=658057 RepID=A0A1Y5T5M0_9RHOB|nr:SH3 domain-containing protein [Pacificibacter marinus]SEK99996.1 Uncharacterized conserved protein YgiM, contains N-terminal SH3 domain, DUF1202 family [Pacificibacter marinus]SLN54581.1 Bacterial SH3 domain protein [Pacificibacter marinus]
MLCSFMPKSFTFITASALSLWAGICSAEMMQVVDIADGDTLNVRQGPSASALDIGDLDEHTYIDVIGYNIDQTWARIQYGETAGWVFAKHLLRGDMPKATIGTNIVTGIAADDPDGGLVVRSGAGTEFAAIGALRNDTMVHVIQQSRDGKWAMIGFGGDAGWVSTSYLKGQTATPTPMPSASPQIASDGGVLPAVFTVTGVAANDRLWVRDAPQPTGGRIGSLEPGELVGVDGTASGDWVQITLNGQIGYINSSYLTRANESSAGTTPDGFPLGIICRGTEPFWTLTIAEDRSVQYTSLINGPDPITALKQTTPAIGGGYPYDFAAQSYTGTLNSQMCSDGMSDISYSMALQLLKPNGQGGVETLHGCCNLN